MALTQCPICGKEISDKAERCPQCKVPFFTLAWRSVVSALLFGVLFVAVIAFYTL